MDSARSLYQNMHFERSDIGIIAALVREVVACQNAVCRIFTGRRAQGQKASLIPLHGDVATTYVRKICKWATIPLKNVTCKLIRFVRVKFSSKTQKCGLQLPCKNSPCAQICKMSRTRRGSFQPQKL